jgi:hypothetical protein
MRYNKKRKSPNDKGWVDSDELKHQLISSSRRRHIAGKLLFMLLVIMAIGTTSFVIWAYCFDT